MRPKHTPLALVSLFIVFLYFSEYTHAQNNIEDFSNDASLSNIVMQFIIEYLNWRRIDHVLLFDSFLQKRTIPNNIIQFMDCMSKQGIYSSLYSTQAQIMKDTFRVIRHRLGVVVLLRYNETIDYNHILIKASVQRIYNEQHAWLLITYGPKEDETTINLLRTLNLGLTSDFILSYQLMFDAEPSKSKSNTSCPIELPRKTFQTDTFSKEIQTHNQQSHSKSLAAFKQKMMPSNNVHNFQHKLSLSKSEPTFSHSIQQPGTVKEKGYFELIQVYKIRRDDENSAVFKSLGSWGLKIGFEKVNQFVPVEGRQDLMGFPLIVGFKNWSSLLEGSNFKGKKSGVIDVDVDDTENLLEIMGFIAHSLNATVKLTPFQSVGQEIQDGVYSDLLNAVVKSEVDLGLEKVTISYRKLNYMAFTHNIIKMSHNIYMHPSEFSVSRDIYLTPFSPKLLLCVLAMSLLLAFGMLMISLVANYRAKQLKNGQSEDVNLSYATLWIVGILAMQGSIWSPISSSGNMTLISSLMFAVIIYNSYAAFITSILSVKTSDIKSLEDLYANGYKVGYIKDSQDESYLTRDIGELKNIYLRGYDARVSNIEEGLLKAANSRFALFVSTQVARKAIQELEPYDCRCLIQEFALRTTMEDVAFPMSKLSPYHKVVNLGVMRLIESGTLSRIQLLMLPDMPTCTADTSFVSAQLEDVITAVELLLIGIVLSVVVAIAECVIKYRRELRKNLKQGAFKCGRRIKRTIENFEF